MAESIFITKGASKEVIYQELIPQVRSLMEGESDLTANLANFAAVLDEAFGHLWTGFYRVQGQELILGPFQGPLACTRIPHGRGVCGTAWKEARTVVVPDVEQFPGHIACSSASRSEIVVPIFKEGRVVMVLDVDSTELNTFDTVDTRYLEELTRLIPLSSLA